MLYPTALHHTIRLRLPYPGSQSARALWTSQASSGIYETELTRLPDVAVHCPSRKEVAGAQSAPLKATVLVSSEASRANGGRESCACVQCFRVLTIFVTCVMHGPPHLHRSHAIKHIIGWSIGTTRGTCKHALWNRENTTDWHLNHSLFDWEAHTHTC